MAATNNSQHMQALARANEVRLFRAKIRREITEGERSAATTLIWFDDKLETMRVVDLLTALPRVGEQKAEEWLRECWASPDKRIGALSDRQRNCIVAKVQAWEYRRTERTAA